MKKYLRWIPLILSLLLIFGLTFQNGAASKQLTENTQAVIENVVGSPVKTNWWNDYTLMRKLGHFPEYILLGLSSVVAFRKWWKAGLFCVGVSFLDEVLKDILPGREFDFVDMRFDFIGYVIGVVIISLAIKAKSKITNEENISNKGMV